MVATVNLVQRNLKEYLDNLFGEEMYDEINTSSAINVITGLRDNNCLCDDESQTIGEGFLHIVEEIAIIFDDDSILELL